MTCENTTPPLSVNFLERALPVTSDRVPVHEVLRDYASTTASWSIPTSGYKDTC